MFDLIDSETILETERLKLEPLTPSHALHLFPILSDERIYTYIPDDPPSDVEALIQRYHRLAARRSPSGDELWLNWAVQRKQDETYVGIVQATVYADQRAHLAYTLASAFWGYGYAQEVCRRLLILLFGDYRVQRVVADVDTRNRASWTLLERLGFTRIAVHYAADHFKGSISDEYIYDLIAENWQKYTQTHQSNDPF